MVLVHIMVKKERSKNMKYICELCGYEYDPALGDDEHGIAPGTDFEDLGENWVCPLCAAEKDDFEAIEE